jgi:DNA-binding SARP family transcriptional activator
MEYRILGPLEVVEDDSEIDLGTSKQRALLAFFLLHANEVVSTERLIDALWDDEPPETAHKALQVYVSGLRKALGRERVETRARAYRLIVAAGELDLERFQRLAQTQPKEALSLWRGQPLVEFVGYGFARSETARLEELRLACVERRIDAELADGLHAELVGELERLVRAHPLRERLRSQLMVALYRSGRQAEALGVYQEARRAMVDELGIEPSKSLRELQQAVLRQDGSLELPAQGLAAVGAEAPAGVFVGREAELEMLRSGLDASFGGHGSLVLLVGEPGIGKSRLTEEIAHEARARGARVVVGRAWEAGGAPAYWPWVQSLRALVGELDDEHLRRLLGVGAGELAGLVPELRERFPDLPSPMEHDPEGARFRLFEAVSTLLEGAARATPIVLALDDLHAADESSLLMLRFVARELARARILVLAAYRDVDPTPTAPLTIAVTELQREPLTKTLRLAGLNQGDVARFIELISGEPPSEGLSGAIHEETDGNPLFVREIVLLLAAESRLDATDGARVAIPQSVRDVIARRLRRLSEECNRILVLASTLGREFRLDALSHMAAIPEDDLVAILEEALAERVVSEMPGSPPRLRFAHILIRDTLYDDVTLVRRVRLHRLAVRALESLHGTGPGPHLAELALHALAASDFESGGEYARRAGDRALGLLAYEEAARLYGMALDALDLSEGEDARRGELLLALGEAEGRAGNSESAKEAFLEAAALARRLGLSHLLARAAAGYGGRIVWARAGGDPRLVELLEEGLAALGDEDLDLRARLLARLAGGPLRDEISRGRRDALSAEAVAIARRLARPATLAYALAGRGAAIVAPDSVEERFAIGTELCDLAAEIGETEQAVDGHYHLLIAHLELAQSAEAIVELEAVSRIADALRQPAQRWQALASRAMIALGFGELEHARSLIPEALAVGERTQPTAAVPAFRFHRFMLDDFEGRIERSEGPLAESVDAYPARPVLRCALAYVHARLGRTTAAQATVADLARRDFSTLPFDFEWLYATTLLAETCALVGDVDSGATLYRLLLPYEGLGVVDAPEGMRGAVARYLGILATHVRPENAERHFERALELNTKAGTRPWLALTKEDYARSLIARADEGDPGRAHQLIDEALTIYSELGMTGAAERARSLVDA